MNEPWILYGAYGFTGRLIAEEALRRGHRPILAGRAAAKLLPLGEELGLPTLVLSLADSPRLNATLAKAPLVMHAAGPYSQTAAPMQTACLDAGCHYLDITGEIQVFEQTFAMHSQAQKAGVSLISGVGFDVVPSDCLALTVAQQLPQANRLETAIAALGSASAGTTKSGFEILAQGNLIRQEGALVKIPLGRGKRRLVFYDRERTVIPFPWGDLATSFRSTGIPNITSYLALPRSTMKWLNRLGALAPPLLSIAIIRKLLQLGAGKMVQGPGPRQREKGRSQLWARATASDGKFVEAWLETSEAYHFTAQAAVRCVEKMIAGGVPPGGCSPAQAFGAQFVLEIPSTILHDRLSRPAQS